MLEHLNYLYVKEVKSGTADLSVNFTLRSATLYFTQNKGFMTIHAYKKHAWIH